MKETEAQNWQARIDQINESIKSLKSDLNQPQLTKSEENNYDIKSKIIDKQNKIIEILLKEVKKKSTVPNLSENDRNKVAF